MKLHRFTFNPLQENTYVIWCETSLDCAIIDAGNYNSEENSILKNFIEEHRLTPKYLLGTHAHIDHIFGNYWVKNTYNIPYLLHSEDLKMIERSETMAAIWNLNYTPSPLPDQFINHGETLTLGSSTLEIRFVPGHAPGHVIFIHHDSQWAVVGDTVFRGSIGRTDLPGGNHELLLQKIEEQIFTLPDNYTLYSGHGPETTVQHEKSSNPFFAGN